METFLEMLVAERGAARNTVEAYRRDLGNFASFVARSGNDLAMATADHIRAYLADQESAGMSPRTAARRLSALRQFFRFLYAEGVRGDDPTTSVDRPKQGQSLPRYLDEHQVERLLAAAHGRNGPEGIRLVALLEVLYASGLRVSELVGLPLSALSRHECALLIRGKGGKERVVPLPGAAREALGAWLEHRRRPGVLAEPLFVALRPRTPPRQGPADRSLLPGRWGAKCPRSVGPKPAVGILRRRFLSRFPATGS